MTLSDRSRFTIRILMAACCAVVSPLEAQSPVQLTRIVGGLSAPVDIQHAGDGSGRLFIVQQNGIIRTVNNSALNPMVLLDIRSKTNARGEQGLLGLAFPPGFSDKQYFYVNYTNLGGNTVISRFRVSSNPDVADPMSEQVVMIISQPFRNHNGGQLRFGPDGYLYIGTGDGGSGNDPLNSGQTSGTLLGKMLRIDVESDLSRYRIPPDNPFAGDAAFRPEIWALGLRNPWRYSFDRLTDDLWIGDVGQNRAEEIDFQPGDSPGGENYGWRLMEGFECLNPGCPTQGLVLPVVEYGRAAGCSVTGGHVYRGVRSPGLRGTYLYGDFCTGNIWGITRENGEFVNRLLLASGRPISTFGEDEAGEVYLADYSSGEILRVDGGREPVFSAQGVGNAASFEPGLVAGSAATAFAAGVMDVEGVVAADTIPLPDELNRVTVTLNGQRAPLYAIANVGGVEQLNFQAGFELEGLNTATMVVTRDGVASAPVQVAVLDHQPAVFTSNGTFAIVVRDENGSLVTAENPLRKGEAAIFYANGLGPVSNNPGTGNGGRSEPLSNALTLPEVTLGGVPCEVTFAGLAPGFVGIFQVNIRVAENAPSGVVELVVSVNGVAGPPVRVHIE